MAQRFLETTDWEAKDRLNEQFDTSFDLRKKQDPEFKRGVLYHGAKYFDRKTFSFIDVKDSYTFDSNGYNFIASSYVLSGMDESSVNQLKSKLERWADGKVQEKVTKYAV